MSFTHKERHAMRERQKIIDAKASEIGQAEAKRYLRSKEVPPTRGNIRAGIAFALLVIAMLIIMMAL